MRTVRQRGQSSPAGRVTSLLAPAGLPRWGAVLLAGLALWSVAPLVALAVRAATAGGAFLGSDGPFAGDQLQYFSWIRESGEHGVIRNRFDAVPDTGAFVHPLFLLSGMAWRLGADVALAFQLWKPVAVVVLFAGVVAYTGRLLPPGWSRAAAVTVALFYAAPLAAVAGWTGAGSDEFRGQLSEQAGEMFPAGLLWGYLPTAIVLGLLAGWFLGIERLLDPARRAPGRSARWYVMWTSATGLLISWLHPWQGQVALVVLAGVLVWGRSWRAVPRLVPPVLATVAPLVGYLVLATFDQSWSIAQQQNEAVRPALWVPVVALAPLALPALVAGVVRRPPVLDVQERIVRLWPLAAAAVYLWLSPSVPNHAWEGVSIPLAVLATRAFVGATGTAPGDRRPAVALAGALAVAFLVVPGTVRQAGEYERMVFDRRQQPHVVTASERAALRYLEREPAGGPVLSTAYLGGAVPAFTGRSSWVGHPSWTPRFPARAMTAEHLFTGRLPAADARRLVRASGVRFLLADCRQQADLSPVLGPLLGEERRFGCARVYEVATAPAG